MDTWTNIVGSRQRWPPPAITAAGDSVAALFHAMVETCYDCPLWSALPVWGLCLGRRSVAMFKQKAASDPSEKVSARTQQWAWSTVQCRLCLSLGKETWLLCPAAGAGRVAGTEVPVSPLPLPPSPPSEARRRPPSLFLSDNWPDFLRELSPAGGPQRLLGPATAHLIADGDQTFTSATPQHCPI